MSQKPSLPRGTRDFGPAEVAKRQYVMGTIRRTFERYGFAPLETPTFENLSTLTGKYGEEGDQLLYRILNSGDFLSDVKAEDIEGGYRKISPKIAEKGLRYDLTVPFARYVVMNRHALTFPFRRYQMQPVWRADRPSKGRYREFVQCDADVVGTDSLLCEAEIVLMIHDVMTTLGLPYVLKINHRDLLQSLYQQFGAGGTDAGMFVAIDKLDKIGWNGVREELVQRGFQPQNVNTLISLLSLAAGKIEGSLADPEFTKDWLKRLSNIVPATEDATNAFASLEIVRQVLESADFTDFHRVELDLTLARGLSYYTGCIFEVVVPGASVGSVSGGGRYDNLTEGFGLKGMSGVGFSFGIDRLCDVLEERGGFPAGLETTTQVLLVQFEELDSRAAALRTLTQLRAAGLSAELYPEPAKLKKQFAYADAKRIPYVVIIGPEEAAAQPPQAKVKVLATGAEHAMRLEGELLRYLLAENE